MVRPSAVLFSCTADIPPGTPLGAVRATRAKMPVPIPRNGRAQLPCWVMTQHRAEQAAALACPTEGIGGGTCYRQRPDLL